MSSDYDAYRERFQESNDRFQEGMVAAIRAHQEGFNLFMQMMIRVEEREGELRESVGELKRLILDQGVELRALKDRLIDPQ